MGSDRGQDILDSLDEVAEVEEGHERDDPQICGNRVRPRMSQSLWCSSVQRSTSRTGFLDAPSRQTRARSSTSVQRTSCLAKASTSSSGSTAAARSTSDDFSLFSFAFLDSVGTSAVGPAGPEGDLASSWDIFLTNLVKRKLVSCRERGGKRQEAESSRRRREEDGGWSDGGPTDGRVELASIARLSKVQLAFRNPTR